MKLSLIALAVAALLATSLYIPPPPTALPHPTITPSPETLHRRGCWGPWDRSDCLPVPKGADGDKSRWPFHPYHPHANQTAPHRPWPFPSITGPGPVMDPNAVTAPVHNVTNGTDAYRWRGPVVDAEGADGVRKATRVLRRVRRGTVSPPGGRRPVGNVGVQAAAGVDVGRVPKGGGERKERGGDGVRGGFSEYVGQGGGV